MKKKSPLIALFLTVLIDLLGFGIVLPLLPQYAKDYEASRLTLAALMAAFSAMQFLFAPMWGRLSDKFGRRPILLVGLAGSTLSYTLFGLARVDGFAEALGFADPVPVLMASRIFAGIFAATIGTAYAYIADVTDAKTRGKGMALIGAAFGVGFTIGPVVGGFADNAISHEAPGFIAAGLSALAFLFGWRALTEPERHQESGARGMAGLRFLGTALSQPTIVSILCLQFLATFAFANMEGTLALFARAKFDYDTGDNAWIFAYLGFSLLVAQGAIVRRLIPKLGELKTNVLGALLLAVGFGGVGLSTEVWHTWTALPIGVVGFALLSTSLQSLLSLRTPESIQGQVLGVGQSVLSLARIAGPAVGNMLLLESRPALPFETAAALMAIACVWAILLSRQPASNAS